MQTITRNIIEPDSGGMDAALRSTIDSELQSGERIVWMDQPIPKRYARGTMGLVLFGIPWTAFSLFWVCAAGGMIFFTGKKPPAGFAFFPLFGLPFVLIGFGMLSSPFWSRRRARKVAYVITDRRAILVTGGLLRSFTIRSFLPAQLGDLRRHQYPDGSGDLAFAQDLWRDNDGDRRSRDVGFMGVRDVKAVEEKVAALARSQPGK
ncbi:MAG: hypothetical protein HYR88_00115 [Verrucomicrobia bacterium]|nr:hypothetical protein [Verrucomicrobiota bacterium]MBI3868287.1 hypothetical protein [Verrucomicrobiota bacterium]